jgi:toxin ParE1/3/4
MKIRWMPLAEQDLNSAYEFVRRDNPKAASRVVARILPAAEMLAIYPSAGHPGRVPSTRELTIARTPYIIAYRHAGSAIQILSVIHTARRSPTSFGS